MLAGCRRDHRHIDDLMTVQCLSPRSEMMHVRTKKLTISVDEVHVYDSGLPQRL